MSDYAWTGKLSGFGGYQGSGDTIGNSEATLAAMPSFA
jgi:hypothetical protein